MPTGPVIAKPRSPLPDWLQQTLDTVAIGGLGGVTVPGPGLGPSASYAEPMVEALGRPVSELLGRVFRSAAPGYQTGVSRLMRLTNWNARTGRVHLHGLAKAAERIEATPEELSTLIDAGALDLDQGAASARGPIARRVAKALGASPSPRTPAPTRAAIAPTRDPTRIAGPAIAPTARASEGPVRHPLPPRGAR